LYPNHKRVEKKIPTTVDAIDKKADDVSKEFRLVLEREVQSDSQNETAKTLDDKALVGWAKVVQAKADSQRVLAAEIAKNAERALKGELVDEKANEVEQAEKRQEEAEEKQKALQARQEEIERETEQRIKDEDLERLSQDLISRGEEFDREKHEQEIAATEKQQKEIEEEIKKAATCSCNRRKN
jgi:hypothetical protein